MGRKIWGRWGARRLRMGVADLIGLCPSPCVTVPNLVVLGQTVQARVISVMVFQFQFQL